ncbi:hypothetical protein [Dinghuibacter silviterrae]|uniref:Universal stress protein family protein n=1 Tax=Dinghuibacter silviterrae TaxID=1539049 RepID=A0A4R8DGV8_9BACT|nr:hypothetical protein [Dinghuibacter silviterrae]TDW96707.1 hypothetical protein EDB95_4543 [Dinghuibacter silviterrae]
MKQVLFVSASHELPQGAFHLLRALQLQERVHARGLFFRPTGCDAPAVAGQKALFASECAQHYIRYDIADNDQPWNKDLLARESRFADVMLASAELFCEGNNEALRAAECPVMIIPEGFKKIGHVYIAYDGSKESMFALRQFCYLFPDLADLPTEIMYARDEGNLDMPDQEQLKRFAQLKFDNMSYSKLHFKAADFFSTWISGKKDALLVSGSFGRSGLSYVGKPSFIEDVIRRHTLPIFIAHA